jgi:hypothetical protein
MIDTCVAYVLVRKILDLFGSRRIVDLPIAMRPEYAFKFGLIHGR